MAIYDTLLSDLRTGDADIPGAFVFKGSVATTADLPATGNRNGDVWHVNADGSEWAWTGSQWEELGNNRPGYTVTVDI